MTGKGSCPGVILLSMDYVRTIEPFPVISKIICNENVRHGALAHHRNVLCLCCTT